MKKVIRLDFIEEKEIADKIAEPGLETEDVQTKETSEHTAGEITETGLKEEPSPEIKPDTVSAEAPVPSDDHKDQGGEDSADKGDRRGKQSKPPYGHGKHSDGRRPRDRDGRPLSNEDKLRMYKRQSEERLLDIKRSRENKVGKKKR